MQNRDVTMVDASIETPKQVICRLAKEAVHTESRVEHRKKIDELRQFLLSGHSVDIDRYRKPPTDILMEDNEEAAALFLVNYFGANMGKIAYHYARQQRINETLLIVTTCGDIKVCEDAMFGFVAGMDTNNDNHVQMLFDLIDGIDDEELCAGYAAAALAARGNQAIILNLTLRYLLNEEDGLLIYTANKDVSQVNKTLRRYPEFSSRAARLYLWAGYREEARKLISDNANVDGSSFIHTAALVGDDALVDELLAKGASIDRAVQGYGLAGNVDKVNTFIARGASLVSAFHGILAGGHFWLIDKYFPNGPSAIVRTFIQRMERNKWLATRTLAFMQDDSHRNILAQMCLFIPDAYKQASELHRLMKDNYLDYNKAMDVHSNPDSREKKSFMYYLRDRHMTYEQTSAIKFKPELAAWYKQAKIMTDAGRSNDDVTALVARYVGKLPYDDGETLRAMTTPAKSKFTLFAPPAPDIKPTVEKRKQEVNNHSKRIRR